MRALKIWGMTMVVVIAVLGLYIYQNNREYQIILLNTNDSHGSILPVDSVGGMAERATFIRMVREKNPYVLLVDAGISIPGKLFRIGRMQSPISWLTITWDMMLLL